MFRFVYSLSSLLPSFLPPLSLFFLFANIKQYYDEHLAAESLLTFSSISLWWSWSWNSGSKMYKSSWFVKSGLPGEFPDGLVVRIPGFQCWAWVQSLVGELRSCKLCDSAKKKTKQEWPSKRFSDLQWSLANDEWKHFFLCIFANTGIVCLLIFTSLIDYFNLHFLDYSEHLPYSYLPLFFL